MKTEKIEFRCTKQYKEDLRKICDERGISVASYIKDAIYQKRQKEKRNV